jgi:hypothetical protein
MCCDYERWFNEKCKEYDALEQENAALRAELAAAKDRILIEKADKEMWFKQLAALKAGDVVMVPNWQPIETAPKDETAILIYTSRENMYVVSYDDTFSAPWRIRNDDGLNEHVPTHWMPLPTAPGVQAMGEG